MKLFRMPASAVLTMVYAATAITIVTGAHASASAGHEPPLKLDRTITLPGTVKGHFDHLIVDLKTDRLFVTPEDFHAVLVIDLPAGRVVHEVRGIDRPHAILFRSDIGKLYVTDGEDGSVKVFDANTYHLEHRIGLLKDADSIGYDSATKYLYVDNGGGGAGQKYSMLSVIDTTANRKIADIKVEGDTLEAMALDVNRPRLYVNNRDKNQVVVVNRLTRRVIGSWPLTMGKTNVAMALDEPHQRLFVGCRSGQIIVLDSNTGKELQALPIVKGVDDLAYDDASRRLYAAGDGAATVYEQTDANHYRLLGNVPTGPVAKTARLVPEKGRYFVAVPQHATQNASILVFGLTNVPIPNETAPAPAYKVDAPAAERLVMETLSAHPFLRKLGLHGIAPDHKVSVILANGNTGKLGKATTEKDLSDIKGGKTYCYKDDDGLFYDMKLPMVDASGRKIGLLVMEIPFTAAQDSADAIREAEGIRKEMASQIPDLGSLFKQ